MPPFLPSFFAFSLLAASERMSYRTDTNSLPKLYYFFASFFCPTTKAYFGGAQTFIPLDLSENKEGRKEGRKALLLLLLLLLTAAVVTTCFPHRTAAAAPSLSLSGQVSAATAANDQPKLCQLGNKEGDERASERREYCCCYWLVL